MDHFDVVAGAARADPLAAGDVLVRPHLGGDGLEDGLHKRPSLLAPAGHHAGTQAAPLLTAGNARTHIPEPFRLDPSGSPLGVGEVGVAAVDNHVAVIQEPEQVVDELVDRRTGLDHEHDLARPGHSGHELFERVATDEVLSRRPAGEKIVHFAGGAVENSDRVAAALDVQRQVLTHHGKSHQSEITRFGHEYVLLLGKAPGPTMLRMVPAAGSELVKLSCGSMRSRKRQHRPGRLLGQVTLELGQQLLLIRADKGVGEESLDALLEQPPPTGLFCARIDGEEERLVGPAAL